LGAPRQTEIFYNIFEATILASRRVGKGATEIYEKVFSPSLFENQKITD